MKIPTKSCLLTLAALAACEGAPTADPSVGSTSQALSVDPSFLAAENGAASAFGTVAYGANGSFYYRTVSGSFTCDNSTFGDPLVGVVKACFLVPPSLAPKVPTQSLADLPSGAYSWSDWAQGIAHDASHWFIIQPGRIWKVPLSSNLDADTPAGSTWIDLPDGENNPVFQGITLPGGNPNYSKDTVGYNHFGDAEVHSFGGANALFVPVQGPGLPPIVAVFDADTLDYVTSMAFPTIAYVNMSGAGGWLAVRPGATPGAQVTLWTSAESTVVANGQAMLSYVFDANQEIVDANGNWAHPLSTALANTSRLTLPKSAIAVDGVGNIVTDMYTMQGATFNDDGSLLYTLNGYCDQYGRIHVFQFAPNGTFRLVKESYNQNDSSAQLGADRSFVFNNSPSKFLGICTGQETEGLDYFDTRGQAVYGEPNSQLHAMLVSNDEGDDHIFLKHYAFTTTPGPAPDTNLALRGTSYQSSNVPGYSAPANLANDGNTDGQFFDGSVSHTDYGLTGGGTADWPGQWWYVDLGAIYTVDLVNIYNRTDCCSERLSHYNVLAYDANAAQWNVISNHIYDDTTGLVSIGLPVGPVQTEYVMVAKTDPNYLHLAEVQVMGH